MSQRRIPVLVVNLDADRENWMRVAAQFAALPGFSLNRISGVAGGTLPQLACDILTKTPGYAVGRGALGVFLAHVSVWEAVAKLEVPFCLILEDDVELVDPNRLGNLVLPSGVDLVFCNEAMQPGPDSADNLTFRNITAGLSALVDSGIPGPGTYGYLLTPAGAQALLNAVRQDLCFGHLDWRLLRYCVTADLIGRVIPNTRVSEILHEHHHWERPAWGVVSGGVLCPAIVKHVWSPSRRDQQDRALAEQMPEVDSRARPVVFEGRTTTFHISNSADHIQTFIHRGEFYRPTELAYHRDLIPMGGTVIDVGANIGNHTLFYAKYTWAARVYPIEPHPVARSLLLDTIAANAGPDCRAEIVVEHVAYALGCTEGWMRVLPAPENNLGASRLEEVAIPGSDAVKCLSLDQLAFEGPIAFLKIDAEGSELDILRGGRSLIAAHRPFIAVEVASANEPGFWQWLEDHEYQVFQVFCADLGSRHFLAVPVRRGRPCNASVQLNFRAGSGDSP